MNEMIAAGVVLYNPEDIERLNRCLDGILEEFDAVYIFDNSTNTTANAIAQKSKVRYLTEYQNTGIAHALNQIMTEAKEDGYTWVVTFDQDSIIPKGMKTAYESNIGVDKDIAIVCPQVIDKRRLYESPKLEPKMEFVKKCITSASCTSIKAWENIGGFDEWLFIDLVDNEFCKRLEASGYKILKLNYLILDQEFGVIKQKKKIVADFWINVSKITGIKNIAKLSYKKCVSPIRVYYTNRNIIYVNRKLRNYGKVAYNSFNCKNYLGFIFSYIIPSIVRSDKKIETLNKTLIGIRDGITKKADAWNVK